MDDSKIIMWVIATVTGGVGGYLPVLLFHADPIGGASILFGMIGTIAGIFLWYKFLR